MFLGCTLFTTHESSTFLKTSLFSSSSFQVHLTIIVCEMELFQELCSNVCHVSFEAINISATEKTNKDALMEKLLTNIEYSISENPG